MKYLYGTLVASIISFTFILSACTEDPVGIYVSPSGSDQNPGTVDLPFASLEQARNHIRELKNDGLNSDVTVYLRDGIYYLPETLVLGLEDSAPDGHRITYRNYPGERPILSSGVRLTGWEKVVFELPGLPLEAADNVWSTDLPDEIHSFYTLYEGDFRLPRAVTDGFFPTEEYSGRNRALDWEGQHNLHFPPGKIKDWTHLDDVEIFIIPGVPWTMNILPLASVDETNSIATTKIASSFSLTNLRRDDHFPEGTVWVENVFEGMREPGNWVLDSSKRKLYLWPKTGRPGNDIRAPKLSVLIKVAGETQIDEPADIPVTGIHFKGLTFTHADRDSWGPDDSGIQHDWEMEDKDNALLRFRGAEYSSVDACHFYNSGGNAIRLDYHARHIEIKNSLFHDLGASAVMMLGYGPGTKDVNNHNKVVNNHIFNNGQIWWHSQMITAWQSGENLIAHNYIHNVPRKAIAISGVRPPFFQLSRRGMRETARSIRFHETGDASSLEELPPYLHSRNNIVEYNHIHDVLEKLGDGAAINISGAGLGNIIRYNYIHDVHNEMADACIRTDNAQRGTLMTHNIVFRSYAPGITPKDYNDVRNNFLIDVSSDNQKGMIRGLGDMGNSDIVRNVLFSIDDRSRDHFYNFIKDAQPPHVYGMMDDNTVDFNVYYNTKNPSFFDESAILQDLHNNGFDRHSLYTDPLFVNWQEEDFRLRDDSPALVLGIEQIDIMDRVGLTDDFPEHLRSPHN